MDCDPSLYATLIASDFVAEGRRAARFLAEHTTGDVRIVELEGTAGSAPAIDRKRGFDDEIARTPRLALVRSQSAQFSLLAGKEVMEAILRAEREPIGAVYAHNDDMALGAIQAIEEAGMTPGKDIIIVSVDAVRGAFEAMKDGKLNCTVECNPLLGPAAFDAVEAVLAGKELPKKTIVKDEIFPQEKAAEVLPTRKY